MPASDIILREATLGDKAVMFLWQSNKETRKYFRNPSAPKIYEHEAWLERAINEPGTTLLVAEEENKPVGVLRFNRHNNSTEEISILVDPYRVNRGIGSALLTLAKQVRPFVTLVAEIHPKNISSIKIFSRAGFIQNGKVFTLPSPGSFPKIAFFPNSKPGMGLGHIRRCLGLAATLKEMNYFPAFFLSSNSFHRDLVFANGFEVHSYREQYSDITGLAAGAHAVVIDSYQVEWGSITNNRDHIRLLVAFDDWNNPCQGPDVWINGSTGARVPIRKNSGPQVYLYGPKYQIIRREILSVSEMGTKSKGFNLLVTLGSGDSDNTILLLLVILEDILSVHPKLQVNVVIGAEMALPEGSFSKNIKFVSATNLPEHLKVADIAWVSGGQSLIEAVYLGIPCIALCLAQNQLLNIQSLFKLGSLLGFVVRSEEGWKKKLFELTVSMIGNQTKIDRVSKSASQVFDKLGAYRVATAIIEQLTETKPIEEL